MLWLVENQLVIIILKTYISTVEDCGLRRYDKVKIPIYADGAQYKIRSAAGSVVNEIGYICGSYYHESTCFSFDGDKEFKVIAENIGKILHIYDMQKYNAKIRYNI